MMWLLGEASTPIGWMLVGAVMAWAFIRSDEGVRAGAFDRDEPAGRLDIKPALDRSRKRDNARWN